MLTQMDWERIALEVAKGKITDESDSPEEAEYRKNVAADVARIKEKGGMVDIPVDLMGMDWGED
jgi:hypothetical protein